MRLSWLIRDIKWKIMRMSATKTQKEVTDIICMLENMCTTQEDYHNRLEYLKGMCDGKYVEINGYEVGKDSTCWLIWKSTDIELNPEYKGESLLMIIPQYLDNRFNVLNVVKNSMFMYQ